MSIEESNLAKKISEDVREDYQSSGNLFKRSIPILVFLCLGFGLWMFFQKSSQERNCSKKAEVTTKTTTDTSANTSLDSSALAAKALWAQTLGEMTMIDLPDGNKLEAPANGFERKLVDYLNKGCPGNMKETWFNCDRLLFLTASHELNSVSVDQISHIATILKAFPNAKIKIGGYTDNVGNPDINKNLSEKRASSVMNAIISNNVAADRLRSEGYGQEHPECATNDTEECRAKNRRVAIRVEQCK